MKTTDDQSSKKIIATGFKPWNKMVIIVLGFVALLWFLIRVIPKPSRASYPCQRAAFPIASAFVIWLTGTLTSLFAFKYLRTALAKYRVAVVLCSVLSMIVLICWISIIPLGITNSFGASAPDTTYGAAVGFDWKPGESNKPIGTALGINPGRVVMARDPLATKWAGNWKKNEDQWWLDKNTDVDRVDEMLSAIVQKLTSMKNDKDAWSKIFKYYNENSRGLAKRGYQSNES